MQLKQKLIDEKQELEQANEAAESWGAAVGARVERIQAINRKLQDIVMAESAVKPFENDLNSMHRSQMEAELREVTDKIEEETSWQEALMGKLKLMDMDEE